MGNLRILVVDDNPLVRNSLRRLLELHSGWLVCSEAENGKQAVVEADKAHPNLILMDVMMPKGNGLEATRTIVDRHPEMKILLFTMYEFTGLLRLAHEAGARGYISKMASSESLIAAVDAVAEGKSFPPSIT